MPKVLLGLIGDNIGRSRSPMLHRLAGRLCGLEVIYESLIPARIGQPFEAVFERCQREAYRGINITYPYKEAVMSRLRTKDPAVTAVGACNTVLFERDAAPQGFNTDYSGFIAAFRHVFPGTMPGIVAQAGAGGVGKAIGFALAELGASAIRLFDPDRAKAEALAKALSSIDRPMEIVIAETIADASYGADGVINCTPLGMVGYTGSAFPQALMRGRKWAFDAVYTPADTQFLQDARAAGLETMSGYELFFHQGIDAFQLFTGQSPDRDALRRALIAEARIEEERR